MKGKRTNKQTRCSGFTLIEVTLAIAILSVMVLLNYKTIRGLIEVKLLLDDKRDGMFIANSVLTRIAREIQLATAQRALLPACDSLGPVPAGAATTNATPAPNAGPRLVFKAEESSMGPGPTLTFLAKEAGQYIPDGGTHSGIVQITYRVTEDPDQKGAQERTLLLVREEVPHRLPATKACADVIRFPITKNLVSLSFQFYDQKNQEWSTSWTEQRSVRLPNIVQFSLTLATPQGQETYTTAIPITSQ
jgi:prepilin-type N-terminal cleavage/methylation domain-containing protein